MTIGEKVVASLRKRDGYDGDGSLESVKTFIQEKNLDIEIDGFDSIDAAFAASEKPAAKRVIVPDNDEGDTDAGDGEPAKPAKKQARNPHTIPTVSAATFKAHADRKRFERRAAEGRTNLVDADEAEVWGAWAKSALFPHAVNDGERAILKRFGIEAKANTSTTYTSGGALVPVEMANAVIDLKEKYGALRQLVPATMMSQRSMDFPRRTGGLTVYAPGEATAITESNPAVDNVTVTAVKLATYTQVSNELLNDSLINFGDHVAGEIAQAFAYDEDLKGFRGDGTSTYHTFQGFPSKFRTTVEAAGGTWTTDAHKIYNPNIVVAASKTWSSITLANFEELLGTLPAYITNPRLACSKYFFHAVIFRLMQAQGGVTFAETASGAKVPTLFGVPVVYAQTMPVASGTGSEVVAMVGEFEKAAKFGEVSGSMSVSTSDQRYHELDAIGIRGVQRIGLAVHDVGTANSSAGSRVAGPVSALVTPN